MDTARHRGTPRKAPILAVAGLTVLGLAAAGTLFTVSPAHAAGPTQPAAQPVAQPVAPSFPLVRANLNRTAGFAAPTPAQPFRLAGDYSLPGRELYPDHVFTWLDRAPEPSLI